MLIAKQSTAMLFHGFFHTSKTVHAKHKQQQVCACSSDLTKLKENGPLLDGAERCMFGMVQSDVCLLDLILNIFHILTISECNGNVDYTNVM